MCCGRLQLNPCITRGRESISMVKVRLQIAGGRRGKIGMRIAALLNIAPCGQSVRSDPVFFAFFFLFRCVLRFAEGYNVVTLFSEVRGRSILNICKAAGRLKNRLARGGNFFYSRV